MGVQDKGLAPTRPTHSLSLPPSLSLSLMILTPSHSPHPPPSLASQRILFPRVAGGVGEASDFQFSLLGLGDIAIPGLLACLALR